MKELKTNPLVVSMVAIFVVALSVGVVMAKNNKSENSNKSETKTEKKSESKKEEKTEKKIVSKSENKSDSNNNKNSSSNNLESKSSSNSSNSSNSNSNNSNSSSGKSSASGSENKNTTTSQNKNEVKTQTKVQTESQLKSQNENKQQVNMVEIEDEEVVEEISLDKSANANSYKNGAAKVNKELKKVASKIQSNRIAEELEEIADDIDENSEDVSYAIDEVETRNKWKKMLIGSDYKNLGQLRSSIVRNKNQIRQLTQIMEGLELEEDKALIQEQIQALNQEQERLRSVIIENEGGFSVLGWAFRFMYGYSDEDIVVDDGEEIDEEVDEADNSDESEDVGIEEGYDDDGEDENGDEEIDEYM